MKCYIKFIGVIDQLDKIHEIEFHQGVNIITGKSSTGKSAILEIFDYCFGASDNTLPVGLITDHAKYYFTILRIKGTYLYLVRNSFGTKSYIFEKKVLKNDEGLLSLDSKMIEENSHRSLYDYKKELGRYFNVTMSSIDEDTQYLGENYKKKSTPSIRSFMSFMLQHQNLVANKHAIFYRFDEKEKREQAIEHLSIFLGYANEEYFKLKQDLYELETKLKKLSWLIPRKKEEKERLYIELKYLLDVYENLTGSPLIPSDIESISKNPELWHKHILENKSSISSTHNKAYEELLQNEKIRTELIAQKREKERERANIQIGKDYLSDYTDKINDFEIPSSAETFASKCPFCEHEHQENFLEVNALEASIQWLNNELKSSPYMKESYNDIDRKLQKEIGAINVKLSNIDKKINTFNHNLGLLKSENTNYIDLVNQSKYRVIFHLEKIIKAQPITIPDDIDKLNKDKSILQKRLRAFNVDSNMDNAEKYLNSYMNVFGEKLDFEESYKPINLNFSFESFDLWSERKNGKEIKKIFLRSMGSGANWLYCHLSLFVGFLRLFCHLEEQCKIPPILFLDQPTQVYFPSLDNSTEKFVPEDLSDKKTELVNHDVEAVSNFLSELIDFCETTKKDTNYKPQIIISDHADNITLKNGLEFKRYVKARWRTRGFIHYLNN